MKYVFIFLLLLSSQVHGKSELTTKKDDFSNGDVTTLRVETIDNNPAVLFFKCSADKKLSLQLVTTETLFPDDANDKVMFINATHKLISEKEPETSNWIMSLMQYDMAQYRGDTRQLLLDSLDAKGLNISFNKRPSVFKFAFDDTKKHIKKLLDKC